MRVAVVGLGAAGLRTTTLLERAGVEVGLFEARGRPGGRLHTVDEGRGTLYEAGGEWIDADHHRVLRLLAENGVAADPRVNWPGKVVFNGNQTTEADLWSDALEDDLRIEAVTREMCRDLSNPPWRNDGSSDLDKINVESFLDDQATSERGRWWVKSKYRSDEGEDLERVSLLGWLCGYLNYLEREPDVMSAYRIAGGSRALCEKILAGLRAEAKFGVPLRRVRQDRNGVKLDFERGSATFDRVVLTMPPPAIERIVFEPALSVEKRCAIEGCPMGRAIKICWEFESRWWADQGWGGSMFCDGPIQQTWDGSLGEAPILTAYICGDEAVRWLSRGDPVREGIFELSKIIPDAPKTFVRGWVHDWVRDPHCLGAYSYLGQGYVLEHMEHIARPERRLHFAGEHTAIWTGFIEGALESAERVAQEILDA